jgi:hypothetical protein
MIYLFQNVKVVEMKEISDFKDGESYFLLTEIDELPKNHQPVIYTESAKGKICDVNMQIQLVKKWRSSLIN